MMKKISGITAVVMLIAAVAFVGYALNHPQMSFPWSNAVTYRIYGIYAVTVIVLFIVSFGKKQRKPDSDAG